MTSRMQVDQASPFMCKALLIRCFISLPSLVYRICIISVLQARKIGVHRDWFSCLDNTADHKRTRTRQTCGPSGSKAAIFSVLLIRAPVASFLELTQMFQTEISFLLGVDILIFLLGPWQGHCARRFPPSLPLLAGEDEAGQLPPPRQPPAWPRSSMVLTSFLPTVPLGSALESPDTLSQRPCAVGQWVGESEARWASGAHSDWLVVFEPIFIHQKKKKICSVFYSALGQEVNSLTSAVR